MGESENEVQLFKIEGDINEETKRADLLQIQKSNSDLQNQIDGSGEAEKVKSFLAALEKNVPQLPDRIKMWQTLRKQDALGVLAGENTKLYYTPEGCNLSIETLEGGGGAARAAGAR